MAQTKQIICAAGTYTALSAGHTNVSFQRMTIGDGRYVIASVLPAAAFADYAPHNHAFPVNLGSLSASDNVYFMPAGGVACAVAVIRG